jgi:hypothetical protein
VERPAAEDALMGIIESPNWRETGYKEVNAEVGNTGSASVLPMTDDEKKVAAQREKQKPPLGFSSPPRTR